MLSCSMWFSAPSFWMGGGLESRCVGRVYGVDGAVQLQSHGTIHTVHTLTVCNCRFMGMISKIQFLVRVKMEVKMVQGTQTVLSSNIKN